MSAGLQAKESKVKAVSYCDQSLRPQGIGRGGAAACHRSICSVCALDQVLSKVHHIVFPQKARQLQLQMMCGTGSLAVPHAVRRSPELRPGEQGHSVCCLPRSCWVSHWGLSPDRPESSTPKAAFHSSSLCWFSFYLGFFCFQGCSGVTSRILFCPLFSAVYSPVS